MIIGDGRTFGSDCDFDQPVVPKFGHNSQGADLVFSINKGEPMKNVPFVSKYNSQGLQHIFWGNACIGKNAGYKLAEPSDVAKGEKNE